MAFNGIKAKQKLRGHLIPVGGIKRTITSPRIILSGDAACFVDNFSGEGIAYAIRSGQIAAEVISNIIERGNGSLKSYESICKSEFGKNLKYALLFCKIMHRFPGILLRIFTTQEEVLDKYLEIAVLGKTYKGYLKWLIPRIPKYLL